MANIESDYVLGWGGGTTSRKAHVVLSGSTKYFDVRDTASDAAGKLTALPETPSKVK